LYCCNRNFYSSLKKWDIPEWFGKAIPLGEYGGLENLKINFKNMERWQSGLAKPSLWENATVLKT